MATTHARVNDEPISVALATYEGERFLQDQLESLARQTRLPAELVVYDDCSTDRTVQLVEEFARTSPFEVRLHRNPERMGFATTALSAAAQCTAPLVAFCDQDDVWLKNKLAVCSEVLAQRDTLLVMHSSVVVDASLKPTGRVYPSLPRRRWERLAGDPWQPVRGMSMVFSAELLRIDWRRRPRSHYLAGEPLHHDEWIYDLARVLGEIVWIDEPLALYRQHDSNVTGAAVSRLRGRTESVFATGGEYYDNRSAQARDWAELLESLAADEHDEERRRRFVEGAAAHRALACRVGRRASVYEPDSSRLERIRRLVRNRRDYRPRSQGGSGAHALARDLAMIVFGRGRGEAQSRRDDDGSRR